MKKYKTQPRNKKAKPQNCSVQSIGNCSVLVTCEMFCSFLITSELFCLFKWTKNGTACNAKLVELTKDVYQKNKFKCKNCYNKEKRKNIKILWKLTVKDLRINIRTFLVGQLFSGRTYRILKIPSRLPNRDIYIIISSPLEQYSNSKIKICKIR